MVQLNRDFKSDEVIERAKEIKMSGGIGRIYVGLSNSDQDPLIRDQNISSEFLKRL